MIVASMNFTPNSTGLCICYVNFQTSYALNTGQSLNCQLNLVSGAAVDNNGNISGIPENSVATNTQAGASFNGNVGVGVFAVIGGVEYTLQLVENGVGASSVTISNIYFLARAYNF